MISDPKVKEVISTDQFEELEKTDTMLDKTYECPVCSHLLQVVGRCETCMHCGWSSCNI